MTDHKNAQQADAHESPPRASVRTCRFYSDAGFAASVRLRRRSGILGVRHCHAPMAQDERQKFLEWSASIGMTRRAAVSLLKHLPDDDVLDPELPNWISSPSYCMAASDPARGGMGIEKQLVQAGFLVIGSCPNGDPVVVSFRDSKLPVFYLSHEEIYEKPFTEVMRKISNSLAAYDKALSTENSGIPLDYWGSKGG